MRGDPTEPDPGIVDLAEVAEIGIAQRPVAIVSTGCLEPLRTHRAATGLLLIRAGLLSRAAAIETVNDLNPVFIDGREMAEWLRSNKVTVLTYTGQWPMPATAEIWLVFRPDVLSGAIVKCDQTSGSTS